MLAVIEVHCYGVVAVIPPNRALMFTDALFELSCGFPHIYKTTRACERVYYMCGGASDYTFYGETFVVVRVTERARLESIIALRASSATVVPRR